MLRALLILLLAEPAAAESVSVQRVGVTQFDTAHIGASGVFACDQFGVFLKQSYPGLSVLERTRLEKLLSEQRFQLSALVDPATSAKAQSLLGVDSMVFGTIVGMDLQVDGGGGAMMMTARLVDTSSGRILWADTRTVKVAQSLGKRFLRGLSGGPGESDTLVANKLIQKGTFELVEDLGSRLPRRYLSPDMALEAASAKAAFGSDEKQSCENLDGQITELGKSILGDEALWWAHRLRESSATETAPGAGYPDAMRQRLTTKVLFWLGEQDLPKLTKKQTDRITEAKDKMKSLYILCGRSVVAKFAGPPSPVR